MERLGHMIRMPDDRRVKHVTFGWLSKLKETEKPRAKYRCTPRQRIKLMCGAGIDQLDIEEMAKDKAMENDNKEQNDTSGKMGGIPTEWMGRRHDRTLTKKGKRQSRV